MQEAKLQREILREKLQTNRQLNTLPTNPDEIGVESYPTITP